jgi:ribosomal protein S18 acetylase RimI-like enzyme
VSVRLRPLREDEYAEFLEHGRRQYADDLLNVFGGNTRARGLYRSLGFVETAVHMQKRLDTNR